MTKSSRIEKTNNKDGHQNENPIHQTSKNCNTKQRKQIIHKYSVKIQCGHSKRPTRIRQKDNLYSIYKS